MNFFRPNLSRRTPRTLLALVAVTGLTLMAGFGLRAQASLLSSSPLKVSLYQGLVTVVPDTSHILELGNAGNDVAASASLMFKPAANNGLIIGTQNTTLEGGELVFNSSNATYPVWHFDSYGDYLRFFVVPPAQPGQEKFTLHKDGAAHVIGKLCLGAATTDYNGVSGACIDSWADLAGSGTPSGSIDEVLTRGNASNNAVGFGVTPGLGTGSIYQGSTALIDVNNTVGLPSDYSGLYGISEGDLSQGSGIYAENPNGYAGYFSGRVAVRTSSATAPWTTHSYTLKISGDVENGYPLEVFNGNTTGLAADFNGAVYIDGVTYPPSSSILLTVTNIRAAGGTTVRAISPSQSGSAIYAVGGASSRDEVGIRSYGGGGAGTSYGAFFRGQVGIEGYLKVNSGTNAGLQINNSPRQKVTTEIRVCPTGSNVCLGRYIYTSSATPPVRSTATDFCYDDINNYTTVCVDAFAGAPVTQLHELR